jgi:hypothetical protein
MLFALPILTSLAIVFALSVLGVAGINYLFPNNRDTERD